MSDSTSANQSAEQIHTIRLTLRDGAAVAYRGWVEANPNGSITIHDERGVKTIYLKDEFREWNFQDVGLKLPGDNLVESQWTVTG